MSVDGLQTVRMTDYDILAIAAGLVSHDAHLAGEGCADGVADIDFNVQTLVHAAPAGTEVARHDAARCRHAEVAKVDGIFVRKLSFAVSVLVVPRAVEV